MIVALLAVPLAGAALLFLARGRAATIVHALAALGTLVAGLIVATGAVRGLTAAALAGVLRVDALSGWMIAIIVVVAALAAAEAPRYAGEGAPRIFYPLFHLMVFAMLLAVSADDVGVMWVAVEGTTLASVFLVNFERTRASLEAAYKYLLICSVGIAIAFVGTVLVYYAEAVRQYGVVEHAPQALRWTALVALAPALSPRVLQLAFVFLVVGYGTKGRPGTDAQLAARCAQRGPGARERAHVRRAAERGRLRDPALQADRRRRRRPGFARRILIALGLLSLAVAAAAFLWNPGNYKRMLAYSSVEHIGLVGLGVGFGGALGVSGALLHVANHGLAKSVVFLLAGRIRLAYGTVELAGVRGLLGALPGTGRGFLLGVLALMGVPPFGLFTSEVMIFAAGFREGHAWAAAAGLVLLVIAFGGLLRAADAMLFGPAPGVAHPSGAGSPRCQWRRRPRRWS